VLFRKKVNAKMQSCSRVAEKLILICLDGLSWNLLHRFCEEGIMSNFTKLMKNGVSSKHKSIKPMLSPLIWATIFTGKSPEKHGVKDFYVNTIKAKQIWEIFHENGERIGVFNPMTAFEARNVNGFYIPGFLTPIISAYPPHLKFIQELSVKVRNSDISFLDIFKYVVKLTAHGCRISTLLKVALNYLRLLFSSKSLSDPSNFYKVKECETLLYSDIFISCAKKYSPTFLVFFDNGIDAVSHWYWKYMEPRLFNFSERESILKFGNVIKNYYRLIDKIVGKILSIGDEKTTFIVISDHGFKAWHEPEGTIRGELNINSFLHYLGIENKVYGIKLSGGGLFRPKNEMQFSEIESIFRKIKLKTTGKPIFIVHHKGPYIEVKINTRVIKSQDEIVILLNSSECTLKEIINFDPPISGSHHPGGVLIISGPDILSDVTIKNASVLDIAPTILAIKKMPIPDDMDGKVLIDIFKERIDKNSLKRITSYESETKCEQVVEEKLLKKEEMYIKERLKELGYI